MIRDLTRGSSHSSNSASIVTILNLMAVKPRDQWDGYGEEVCPSLCQYIHGRMGMNSLPQMSKEASHLAPISGWWMMDVFGIWPHPEKIFHNFMNILNNHHESITLKFEINKDRISFLLFLLSSFTDDGFRCLGTKVFFKSTDTHALLHKFSFHPRHTFRGIVYSQLIQFRWICSRPQDFEEDTSTLFQALRGL